MDKLTPPPKSALSEPKSDIVVATTTPFHATLLSDYLQSIDGDLCIKFYLLHQFLFPYRNRSQHEQRCVVSSLQELAPKLFRDELHSPRKFVNSIYQLALVHKPLLTYSQTLVNQSLALAFFDSVKRGWDTWDVSLHYMKKQASYHLCVTVMKFSKKQWKSLWQHAVFDDLHGGRLHLPAAHRLPRHEGSKREFRSAKERRKFSKYKAEAGFWDLENLDSSFVRDMEVFVNFCYQLYNSECKLDLVSAFTSLFHATCSNSLIIGMKGVFNELFYEFLDLLAASYTAESTTDKMYNACMSIREVLDSSGAVLKSELAQKFFTLLKLCSLAPFFQATGIVMDKASFSLLDMASNVKLKVKEYSQAWFLYALVDFSTYFYCTGYKYVTGKVTSLTDAILTPDMYIEWYDEFRDLKKISDSVEPNYYPIFLDRLNTLMSEGRNLFSQMRRSGDPATFRFQTLLLEADALFTRVTVTEAACKPRPVPLSLLIEGPPGMGKSTITTFIFKCVGDAMNWPTDSHYLYTRQPNEEWWNGYSSEKWAVLFDDIAQTNPDHMQDPAGVELIAAQNSVPFLTPQAFEDKKGKIYLANRLLIATTNNGSRTPSKRHGELNLDSTCQAPAAGRRRFPFRIIPKVKDQFRDSYIDHRGNKILTQALASGLSHSDSNYWTFDVDRVKVIDNWNTLYIPVLEGASLSDFEQWLAGVAREHFAHADSVIDNTRTLLQDTLCPICNRYMKHHNAPCAGPLTEEKSIFRAESYNYDPVAPAPDLPPFVTVVYYFLSAAMIFIATRVFGIVAKQEHKAESFSFYYWWELQLERWRSTCLRVRIIIIYSIALIGLYSAFFTLKPVPRKLRPVQRDSIWDMILYAKGVFVDGIPTRDLLRQAGERISLNTDNLPLRIKLHILQYRKIYCGLSTLMISYLVKTLLYDKDQAQKRKAVTPPPSEPQKPDDQFRAEGQTLDKPTSWQSFAQRYDVRKIALLNSSLPLTYNHCRNRIKRNLVRLHAPRGKGWASVNALGVSQQIYVTNAHFFRDLSFPCVVQIDCDVHLPLSRSRTCVIEDAGYEASEDIVFIRMNGPLVKDISHMFLPKDVGDVAGTALQFNLNKHTGQLEETNRQVTPNTISYSAGSHTYTSSGVSYPVTLSPAGQGYCGAPLLIELGSRAGIFGVHACGNTAQTSGFAIPITGEMVEAALAHFAQDDLMPTGSSEDPDIEKLNPVHHKSGVGGIPEGKADVFGSLPDVYPSKLSSKVCKTPIFSAEDAVDRVAPILNKGMYNGQYLDPMTKGITAIVTSSVLLSPAEIRRAASNYYNRICSVDLSLGPIDLDQSINGIDGCRFIDKMNFASSTGYPFNKPKTQFLCDTDVGERKALLPIMQSEYNKIHDRYLTGHCYAPIFLSHLKDEPVSREKREIGKTRVFQASSFAWCLVVRQYYLPIVAHIQNHSLLFECAVGMNVASCEWRAVYEYLTYHGEDRIVAGDYSAFDKNMDAQAMLYAFGILIKLARASKLYSETDCRVMQLIAHDICHPHLVADGVLFQAFNSNPSGHPLTVIINSIVNSLYMRIVFHKLSGPERNFDQDVSLVTYGDDNIMGVTPFNPDFNHTDIQEVFSLLGIKYTMADKKAKSVPFIHISQADFLKRRWVERDGTMCAPLAESSIYGMVNVWVRSSFLTEEEQLRDVLDSAFREWWHYGRERFEKETQILVSRCQKIGIIISQPKYEDYKPYTFQND